MDTHTWWTHWRRALVRLGIAAASLTGCEDNPGGGNVLGSGEIFAHDATALYRVDLDTGSTTKVGSLGSTDIIDLALASDGVLYALTREGWSHVDPSSGSVSQPFAQPIGADATGMDVGPDGQLYTAQGNDILRFDPLTGAGEKLIIFPAGTGATGDAAFLGDRLYVVASNGASSTKTDSIVELSPLQKGAASKIVGDTGFACIRGLVGHEGSLYGFTCEGSVLRIDPSTGQASVVTTPKVGFEGAGGR